MVGGSADLTGSNNTRTAAQQGAVDAGELWRAFRALGHSRACDGGGHERHGAAWRHDPYSGTFLVFSDYSRPGHPAWRADGVSA
jgi:transketolase